MDSSTNQPAAPIEAPVGRSVKAFCKAAGFSVAMYYTLPLERRPRAVRLGKRVIVVEQPANWFERIAKEAA